jgi:VWFA-related protein
VGLSITRQMGRVAQGMATAVLALGFFGDTSSSANQNPLNAPGQSPRKIKVEVRVVLLDVVVTNKKGDPVTGLSKENFEVTEDGAPQAVSFFEEHKDTQPAPSNSTTAPAPDSSEPLPPNTYTSSQAVKPSDSVNVLLLDWLNTEPPDQSYVRGQVIKYLRTVPPGTRLAIFALGNDLRIVQGFTTESGFSPRNRNELATIPLSR